VKGARRRYWTTDNRQAKQMQVREVDVVKYKKVLSSRSTGPSRGGHKDFWICYAGWQ
jgi:hypothetical protein